MHPLINVCIKFHIIIALTILISKLCIAAASLQDMRSRAVCPPSRSEHVGNSYLVLLRNMLYVLCTVVRPYMNEKKNVENMTNSL